MELYIGIDPGASGGIAGVDDDGRPVRAVPMPLTEADVLLELVGLVAGRGVDQVHAVIEHVQAFPKMGVCSAFTFGRGYGALLMALTSAGFPFDVVVPRKWQAALSCLSGGDKNVTKRRAQALFPTIRITHATADALLIAEYGRRLHRGILAAPGGQHGTTQGRTETGQGQASPQAADEGAREASRPSVANPPRDGARPRRRPRSAL